MDLFSFLSFSPGPFWLLILFLPRNQKAMWAVDAYLIFLAGLFSVMVLPQVPEMLPVIAKPTLEAIRAILATEHGTIGAWNHMILADLWMGRWVAIDSLDDPRAGLVRAVCIPIILFFGPLGVFSYLLYRMVVRRKFALLTSV